VSLGHRSRCFRFIPSDTVADALSARALLDPRPQSAEQSPHWLKPAVDDRDEAVVADSRGIPDFGLLHADLAAGRTDRLLYYGSTCSILTASICAARGLLSASAFSKSSWPASPTAFSTPSTSRETVARSVSAPARWGSKGSSANSRMPRTARGALAAQPEVAAPLSRLAVRRHDPRWEPGALAAHAGICAGGGRPYRNSMRRVRFSRAARHPAAAAGCFQAGPGSWAGGLLSAPASREAEAPPATPGPRALP
jgi:hypothetical protein